MVKDKDYQRMLGTLKEEGFRITGPRRVLLKLIATTPTPLSVQELHAAANRQIGVEEDEEAINLVTVYRFANLLVDKKLARRIELGQGYYRYERAESQDGPHHHHMVCESCGKIEDVHGCVVAEWANALAAESGFRVERHQLELFGTCADCLRKAS